MYTSPPRILTPGIERLIQQPSKFRPEVAQLTILRAAAKFYGCTADALRKMDTDTDAAQTLADRIASQTREELQGRCLGDKDQVNEYFALRFDNELLAYARLGDKQRARTDSFYSAAFHKLGTTDHDIQWALRNEDARKLAMMDAIHALLQHRRSPNFIFTKSAKSYFFGIFYRRCNSRLKALYSKKNSLLVSHAPELLNQYSDDDGGHSLFAEEEHDEEMKEYANALKAFGLEQPEKMELLTLRHLEDVSYHELALLYNIREDAMRKRHQYAREAFKKFIRRR